MKKSKLLFYLDDDRDDLEFFKEIASSLGHQVSTFMHGQEMLQTLKLSDIKPDIIFLDIHMPILNGQEMLDILKKSDTFKYIPVVMMSGAYPKKLIRHFNDAGADYLMKKPVGSEMKNALEKILQIDWSVYSVSA